MRKSFPSSPKCNEGDVGKPAFWCNQNIAGYLQNGNKDFLKISVD
jgi:hypothetical protein